jgi:hypothetical protein
MFSIFVCFSNTASLEQRSPHRRLRSSSRSRAVAWSIAPHFVLCESLFAASVRSTSLRFGSIFWINLPRQRRLPQMKRIKSRYRNRPTAELLKYRLYSCRSNYRSSPSPSYRKICSVMHQLRNTKVNENTS